MHTTLYKKYVINCVVIIATTFIPFNTKQYHFVIEFLTVFLTVCICKSVACVMWFPPIFELQTVDFGGRLDAASSLSDCWNACLNNAQCILFNWDGNAPHGQRCFISTIDIFQFNFTYHGFYRNCLLNGNK